MPSPPSPDDDFTARYAAVAPALHAWACLSVRGPPGRHLDAEDLTQEVCVAAYRGNDGYDAKRGSYRAWIFGVAKNVLLMQMRSLARAHARSGTVEALQSRAGTVPEDATTVSRRVARDEGLARAVHQLQQLDEEDRQLMLYRGLEGLKHAEVGQLMGLETEQAKKRWQRLRTRLMALPEVAEVADLLGTH